MLHLVEIVNSQGAVLSLPLDNEGADGFVLKGMEGLEPVNATLVSSSFANMDGAQYESARREARNLKLKLGFNPDWVNDTVRTLRDKVYRFFMPKTEITFRFHIFDEFDSNIISQNHLVQIVARVETCTPDIFSKDPAVDISTMAFDPDFIDPVPVVLSGMSTAGPDETVITYDGTVENGVLFRLLPDRAVDSFTVYHRPPDGTLRQMDYTGPLLAGDILRINTVMGSKSVVRNSAGIDSSVLYSFAPQNVWMELQPGDNHIRVYVTGAPVPYDLTYTLKYGGL